jgi:hypothetical protein
MIEIPQNNVATTLNVCKLWQHQNLQFISIIPKQLDQVIDCSFFRDTFVQRYELRVTVSLVSFTKGIFDIFHLNFLI